MEVEIQVDSKTLSLLHQGKWNDKQKEAFDKAAKNFLADVWNIFQDPVNLQSQCFIQIMPVDFTCCICFEMCSKKNAVRVPCGCKDKFYHKECLRMWYKVKKICPTCRHIVVSSPPYIGVKVKNPFKEEEPKKLSYQCDGSTHPRKSTYVNLNSALEHIRVKHNVPIQREKNTGTKGYTYRCLFTETCSQDNRKFTDMEMMEHLRTIHHSNVITPIMK